MTPGPGVGADSSFPEPAELAPAVRFWAATFTQYGHRDLVIHDRVQPGLVYDVVRDVVSPDDPRVQASIESAVARLERSAKHEAFVLVPAGTIGVEPLARIRTHRGMREAFAQGLTAERLFRPAVRRALEAEGLPLDLAALPLVESCYHPGRVSRAGAVGLWQLTADVGDRYLRIDGKVDERRDPARSSCAAAAHLRELYERFKSWPLALTAYNRLATCSVTPATTSRTSDPDGSSPTR
jgi:membrane-bound lytic murein transglycosylase D